MSTKTAVAHHHRHAHAQRGWVTRVEVWLEAHHRVFRMAAFVVLGLMVLAVAAQLLYPRDRALPYMYIGGLAVGGQERQVILAQLDGFAQNGEVTVKTPSRQWQAKWQTIGLNVDRDASADVVLAYEWWERLLPFSSVARILASREQPLVALVDPERLRAFAEKIVAEDKAAAQNATISVKDGQVHIDDAKSGYRYQVSEIERQIQALPMAANGSVELLPETVPFVRSKEELEALAIEVERLLSRPIVLHAAGRDYRPERVGIGQWITFTENPQTHQLSVAISHDSIRAYLEQIDKDIKIEPGVSTVTLLDGQEVARTPAESGQTVAVEQSIATIESALRNAEAPSSVPLQTAAVPPRVEYVRTYSKASSGLQALIQDWERSNYGDFGIIVRELGGEQRYAEWQPDKPFVTSSTYKMFLVYTVLTKIQQGVISHDQTTDIGWTVHDCIVEVITHSTNPCAISMQNLVGWQTVDDMLHAAGFASTFLNNQAGGDKYTTVRDEANFLLRLQSGTLMNGADTDFLLGLMKRQVWRGGIPSGVPYGTVVANKVGFYNGWVHDVAIVYSPKTTYILAIMSKGGSDPQFANLSRQVYNFFNN